jgi:sensor domain CHASE-containing protein
VVKEILQITKLEVLTSRCPLTFDQLQSVSTSLISVSCGYGFNIISTRPILPSFRFPNLKRANLEGTIADLYYFFKILENSIPSGYSGSLENLRVLCGKMDPTPHELSQFKASLRKVIEV